VGLLFVIGVDEVKMWRAVVRGRECVRADARSAVVHGGGAFGGARRYLGVTGLAGTWGGGCDADALRLVM
jgi:hypothetical protein